MRHCPICSHGREYFTECSQVAGVQVAGTSVPRSSPRTTYSFVLLSSIVFLVVAALLASKFTTCGLSNLVFHQLARPPVPQLTRGHPFIRSHALAGAVLATAFGPPAFAEAPDLAALPELQQRMAELQARLDLLTAPTLPVGADAKTEAKAPQEQQVVLSAEAPQPDELPAAKEMPAVDAGAPPIQPQAPAPAPDPVAQAPPPAVVPRAAAEEIPPPKALAFERPKPQPQPEQQVSIKQASRDFEVEMRRSVAQAQRNLAEFAVRSAQELKAFALSSADRLSVETERFVEESAQRLKAEAARSAAELQTAATRSAAELKTEIETAATQSAREAKQRLERLEAELPGQVQRAALESSESLKQRVQAYFAEHSEEIKQQIRDAVPRSINRMKALARDTAAAIQQRNVEADARRDMEEELMRRELQTLQDKIGTLQEKRTLEEQVARLTERIEAVQQEVLKLEVVVPQILQAPAAPAAPVAPTAPVVPIPAPTAPSLTTPPAEKVFALQKGTYNPYTISLVLMSGVGLLAGVIIVERVLPSWFQRFFPAVAESNRQLAQFREKNSYSKTVSVALSPEHINGRAAMMGFVAGMAAEAATGQALLQQAQSHPIAVAVLAGLVTLGSIMPVLTMGATDEALGLTGERIGGVGPRWTPEAERLNGQAAMAGLAGVVLLELILGHSLVG